MRTHPIRPEAEIRQATEELLEHPADMVVATTGIGVRGWLEAADALLIGEQLRATLRQARILVRGPKAHGAAITAELDVEWNAPGATTAEVVAKLAEIYVPGLRVAVQVDGAAEQPLIGDIRAIGYDVLPVPVYRWTLPDDLGPAQTLVRAVAERRVDAVSFTSRPAAENFVELTVQGELVDEVRSAMATDVIVCCVGAISAEGLRGLDLEPGTILWPDRFRLGAMVTTLTSELQSRNKKLAIGGHQVVLQGRIATVGAAEPVMLAVRERQVLDVLVEEPGHVRSKGQLLDRVWGSHESGPHVVEVTVGRLRRRLGEAGIGIETVMRRGYRISPT